MDSPSNFLHLACENGHLQVVQQLIEFGANVNQLSGDGLTPLSMACAKGHKDVARLLVSKGAFVHSPELGRASPILLACCTGNHDVVEFLLSQQPHLLQTHGKLLIYDACSLGHLSIVKLLIRRGVDVNPASFREEADFDNGTRESPLHGACLGQQTDIVNYLMENGAEVTEEIVETFWEIIGDALLRYRTSWPMTGHLAKPVLLTATSSLIVYCLF